MKKNKEFRDCAAVFAQSNSSKDEIIRAGEKAMLIMYGSRESTLSKLRESKFKEKEILHTECENIEKYPPTSNESGYHSLRVFHQVMHWNDISLDPIEYGFMIQNGRMLPTKNYNEIAPHELLDKIKCTCTKTCINCTCARLGVKCSIVCLHCNQAESSC